MRATNPPVRSRPADGGPRGPGPATAPAGPGARRPTIEDVARLAGVSRGTVSRALNGGRNVRPAVLDVVNQAIETLGYSVNQAARNLARGRTGSIAFVISEAGERLFEDPNFGVWISVFSRQLRERGRHLLVTTAQDAEEEAFLGDYLTLGHVDGALLALTHGDEQLLARLLTNRLPTVVLGRPLGFEADFSWVSVDEQAAAKTATSYLRERVPGPIGTITGPMQTSSGIERLAGFRAGLGRRFSARLVVNGDWSAQSGRAGAESLLDRCPELGGLFVGSDLMAVGAIQALRAHGRRIPEDVAVVGFDDSAAATMVEPGITTMRNPLERVATEAVRILDELLSDRQDGPVHTVLPSELVERGSASRPGSAPRPGPGPRP